MTDEEQEEAPDKLDQQISKVHVLSADISYLMLRSRNGNLSSIQEHIEVQEEIHDLQRILADWDSYLSLEIAKIAAAEAVSESISRMATRFKMQSGGLKF